MIEVTRLAGVRLGLEDGSWILLRPDRAGVEITVEATRARDLEVLAEGARRWVVAVGDAAGAAAPPGNGKPDKLQLPG